MKNFIKILLLVVFIIFMSGCVEQLEQLKAKLPSSLGSSSYNLPLNKKEIKEKLIGGKLYRDSEEIYFTPEGTIFYKDLETKEKKYGTWYIRSSLVNYKNNRKDDMICIALNVKNKKAFTYAPCLRLFRENDKYENLYLAVSADCKVSQIDSKGYVPCKFRERTFGYYRISKTKMSN